MTFNGSIELNNIRRDDEYSNGMVKAKSPVVEIFAYMAAGKNLDELDGKLKDSAGRVLDMNAINTAVKDIQGKAFAAGGGNQYAAAELNEIRKFTILPLLQEELQLLSFMGNYESIGYNDSIYAEVSKLGGDKSQFQALGGDVLFPAFEHDRYAVPTTTISGGYAVDYRKLQFGDMSQENIGMEQVRVDIRNKAARYVIFVIWNSINNTNNVKFVAQGAGVAQSALNEMVRNIRRFGQVNIFGDYSMVSQINAFHGYDGVVPVVGGVSQAALNELRRTGLVGMYMGSVVAEIQNAFNLTRPLPTGDGFELYFPDNIMFVVPAGLQSPIRTWTRGGLSSVQGVDVATGRNLARFDLEIAADVARTNEYKVGIITDTALGAGVPDPRA